MMLSSWSINPRWYRSEVCPRNKRAIASPSAIRTMCCFTLPESALEEEFHLDAGQLDHVVVPERARRVADRLAVHHGLLRALHVRDEVPLRAPREHGDLDAGLAERRQGLQKLERPAGIRARKQLNDADRLLRRSCRSRLTHGFSRLRP